MMSEERSFVAPPPTKKDSEARIILFGDSGVTGQIPDENMHVSFGAPELVASAVERDVESGGGMVMHLGDIVYSNGQAYLWDQWGAMVQGTATKVRIVSSCVLLCC